jgi:hypothetical protein
MGLTPEQQAKIVSFCLRLPYDMKIFAPNAPHRMRIEEKHLKDLNSEVLYPGQL